MTRMKLPAIAAAFALIAAFIGGVGVVDAASDTSPVDEMLGDEEGDSMLPSVSSLAQKGAAMVNQAGYTVDKMFADEKPTAAKKQAQLTREAFNNRSGWVDYYNSQDYPTDTSWKAIAIHYEGESSSETDYLVLTYDDSGNISSATMKDTYDGEADAEQTVSGPLVHSYDEDTREAHELVKHVHSEYVQSGDDITEDKTFLGGLATDYAGHTSGDLSP